MKTTHILLASTLAVLLTACGGGGGDDAPPAAQGTVPDSASASVKAMVVYLTDLVADSPDSAEPLGLADFAPPRPDTAEPTVVK
jgi:predicted small lipoprotein YifL